MATVGASPYSTAADSGVGQVRRPTPLRDSVHDALLESILDGTFGPGRHLVENELAGLLGVSRRPVREALQRLDNEGWVDLRSGTGAVVHVPAEDELDQLLTARTALASESARLAARHAMEEAKARLRPAW